MRPLADLIRLVPDVRFCRSFLGTGDALLVSTPSAFTYPGPTHSLSPSVVMFRDSKVGDSSKSTISHNRVGAPLLCYPNDQPGSHSLFSGSQPRPGGSP